MGVNCPGCDIKLGATRVCHCAACCETFSVLVHFDRHRRNGQCLDPSTIRTQEGQPLLRLDKRGYWVGYSEDEWDDVFKKKTE